MNTVQLVQAFDLIQCYACGVAFAVPAKLKKTLLETHRDFWCPNGHQQAFVEETEAERLRKEMREIRCDRDAARQALVRAEASERKIRTRIEAGVCPCCNRTFENLARHMKTKHPTGTVIAAPAKRKLLLQ